MSNENQSDIFDNFGLIIQQRNVKSYIIIQSCQWDVTYATLSLNWNLMYETFVQKLSGNISWG